MEFLKSTRFWLSGFFSELAKVKRSVVAGVVSRFFRLDG